jgi:hypothetical protein
MRYNIKFYEKFYCGCKEQGKDQLPLGFATPYEENAAFKKRKKTVDDWAGQRGSKIAREPSFFDNVPASGFELSKVVSRYRTSNKLFRINDPRGFQLEISAENLFELIDISTVMNGVFQNKLVWGRMGANNWLWPANSEEYQKYLKGPSTYVHAPGDVINIHSGNDTGHHVYLGRFYCHILSKTYKDNPNFRGYHYSRYDKEPRTFECWEDLGLDTKPFHVYRRFDPNRPGSYKDGALIFKRTAVKKDTYEKSDVTPPVFDEKEWNKFYSATSHGWFSIAKLYDKKPKSLPTFTGEQVKVMIESCG